MNIKNKVKESVIKASSSNDYKIAILEDALTLEENPNAIWALEMIIENIKIANDKKTPLCDDTGIPHILIEIGNNREISGELLCEIYEGIGQGLDFLPGRPMAVKGLDIERIEQSRGLYDGPSKVEVPNIIIDNGSYTSTYSRKINEDTLNIHIVFLGGGPEIRAKTYRIFHKKDYKNVLDESCNYLKNALKLLGCTPAIPSIGIGRTHTEANQLMIKGLIHGNLKKQSNIEKYITDKLNKTNIGPLGLGGLTTVLGTFINIGPQRASGVRIVSSRPACFVEPRIATINLR